MRISATFVNFAGEDPDVIELVHAWDEFSIDNNPEGYQDTLQESLATYGDSVLNRVTVEIVVDQAAIIKALSPKVSTPGRIA